jgi:hypothetical protein
MREDRKTGRSTTGRRELLKLAGLGGTVAGVVALLAPAERAEASEAAPRRRGYRETAHVKTYYELARF